MILELLCELLCVHLRHISICVVAASLLCVWVESMTESERGCAAGSCFLFTLRKQKLKAEQSAGKSGESALFACACLSERERETERDRDICEVIRFSLCIWTVTDERTLGEERTARWPQRRGRRKIFDCEAVFSLPSSMSFDRLTRYCAGYCQYLYFACLHHADSAFSECEREREGREKNTRQTRQSLEVH